MRCEICNTCYDIRENMITDVSGYSGEGKNTRAFDVNEYLDTINHHPGRDHHRVGGWVTETRFGILCTSCRKSIEYQLQEWEWDQEAENKLLDNTPNELIQGVGEGEGVLYTSYVLPRKNKET